MQNRLKWSVLALAQPADVQLSLFPDFVCKGDELALNFDEGLREWADDEDTMTAEQRSAIHALDALILSLSGEHNAAFWFDENAIRSHPAWEEIRGLASQAALAFGWELKPPPPPDDIYVPAV